MEKIEKNALNTVRLLTAMQVLYGHTCTHLNLKMPEFITFLINFFYGVPVFFALSGYLIWNSIRGGGRPQALANI